jgi:N-acetylmuramoyl-L-alanine amidase
MPKFSTPFSFPRPSIFLILGSLLAIVWLSGCATPGIRSTQRTFNTVILDPGHGGKDNGASARSGLHEKTCTLAVALLLRDELRKAGYKVVMTRESDVFIPLNDRAALSNRYHNAVYVSIHFNDSPRRSIHGTEIYYNSTQAIPLAQNIADSMSKLTTRRFIKHAEFRVLRLNKNPAVLVECAYLSNRPEASNCSSDGFRKHVAEQIAVGIFNTRKGE